MAVAEEGDAAVTYCMDTRLMHKLLQYQCKGRFAMASVERVTQ